MTDAITLEQREALRSAHEDGQLYAALSDAISAKAVEKFEEKHARNRTFFVSMIVAALGIFGGGLPLSSMNCSIRGSRERSKPRLMHSSELWTLPPGLGP